MSELHNITAVSRVIAQARWVEMVSRSGAGGTLLRTHGVSRSLAELPEPRADPRAEPPDPVVRLRVRCPLSLGSVPVLMTPLAHLRT
ncbi:MAG TPA: hypothetical protein VL068_13415 [Microthrixaceae bacterium]|nr:hypothetical protein [Microthrixaceae bacterium]